MEVQLSNVNKFLWRISHKASLESAHKKKISNLSFDWDFEWIQIFLIKKGN